MFLEHFFYEPLYLGKMPKGGGGIWSTLKGFILLNSINIVLNLGKMSKGGGACQKYWSTFLGLLTISDFLKVLEERTVFKSLIHFQKSTK
jgi:hypothetical protein